MKKLMMLIVLLSVTLAINAQTAEKSWSFGFGFSYPRYFSTDLRPEDPNFGGFLILQRNFSEHVALRLKGFFYSIDGRVPGGIYYYENGDIVPSGAETVNNILLGGDLDASYYFVPCASVSPFISLGLGGVHYQPDWANIVNPGAKAKFTVQLNFGAGIEWRIGDSWKLNTGMALHSIDSGVDGIINNDRQGALGSNSDGYITFDLGVKHYFAKGEPSEYCRIYEGVAYAEIPNIENLATKQDVEEIVERHIPKEVVREVVVEKTAPPVQYYDPGEWVLVGVGFDFGSSNLKPQSYPILMHALRVLNQNPEMRVEIGGHTDNIGSVNTNQVLALKRANTVRDYLVAGGISPSRLTTVGYGELRPIADNKTDAGRAMNRRIEFKVLE